MKRSSSSASTQTDSTAKCNAETQVYKELIDCKVLYSRWERNNVTCTGILFSNPKIYTIKKGRYENGKPVQVETQQFFRNATVQTAKEERVVLNIKEEIKKRNAELEFLKNLLEKKEEKIKEKKRQKEEKEKEEENRPQPFFDHEELDALFEDLNKPRAIPVNEIVEKEWLRITGEQL